MSVPRLDLAPKLKRRLLIWNPLDHLRLLYWVFFFPRAIPWYIETFTSGLPDLEGKDLRHRLMAIWNNPLRRLQIQSILCAVIVSSVIAAVLQFTGMSVSWIGVVSSIAIGGLVSISRGTRIIVIARNIAHGMIVSILGCVAFGVAFGSSGSLLFVGIAFGVALGLMVGVSHDIGGGVQLRRVSTGVRCIVIGIALFGGVMALNIVVTIVDIGLSNIAVERVMNVIIGAILNSVLVGFITGIVSQLVLLRFEAWLIGMVSILGAVRDRQTFTHVTPIPLPGLRHSLRDWLIEDWEIGLHNADQLLDYTSQYVPVIGAVNDALDALPNESLLPALERLNEQLYGYTLLRFTSISMGRAIWAEVVRGFLIIPDRLRQKLVTKLGTDPRLDTPVHAAASGFLCLGREQPEKSAEAFEIVRSFPHWNEVVQLARAIAWADWARTSDEVISLTEWPEFDKAEDGLPLVEMRPHPFAWQAFRRLKRTVSEVRTAWRSYSPLARLQALNRGLDELAELLKSIEMASTEYNLTREIAKSWQDWLQRVKKEGFSAKVDEASEKQVPEPVRNPYQVGGPVIGPGFVGREDIMDDLARKWAASSAALSVVLYGHRRMGKTSILRNLSSHLGASVHVAYRDLNLLGNVPEGVRQILRTLADDIAQELRRTGYSVPEVNPAAFETYDQAFEQYLRSVRDVLGRDRLVIALDEFEQLEEWINAGRIPQDFLKMLRGYIQMDPHIVFAFAGLHNLEEMNEDYFNPFYASVQPVKVSFFRQAAVYQALERSVIDFVYEQDALERVWELTAGQPYLVELIGYRLVERYNELVVRPGARLEPRFTVTHVDAVIADPEFYSVGRQYFTGIWGQAEQGEPGQLDVLSALASHRDGLTLDALMAATNLNKEALSAALKVLNRHDVVVQDGACWHYTVELMRRWVIQEHGQSPDSE